MAALPGHCPRCGRRMKGATVISGTTKYPITVMQCDRCGDDAFSGKKIGDPRAAAPYFVLAGLAIVAGALIYSFATATPKPPIVQNQPEDVPPAQPLPYMAPIPVRRPTPIPPLEAAPTASVEPAPYVPPTIAVPRLLPPKPPANPAPAVSPDDQRKIAAMAAIASLKRELQDAREKMRDGMEARDAARRNVTAGPEYLAAVKAERESSAEVERLRIEQSPDLDVSRKWIAAKGIVARMESEDPAVHAASDAIAAARSLIATIQGRIADQQKIADSRLNEDEIKSAIARREFSLGMTYAEACRSANSQGAAFGSQGVSTVYRWSIKSRVGSHSVITASHFNATSGTYRNEYEEVADYRITSYVEGTFSDGKLISFRRIPMGNGQ